MLSPAQEDGAENAAAFQSVAQLDRLKYLPGLQGDDLRLGRLHVVAQAVEAFGEVTVIGVKLALPPRLAGEISRAALYPATSCASTCVLNITGSELPRTNSALRLNTRPSRRGSKQPWTGQLFENARGRLNRAPLQGAPSPMRTEGVRLIDDQHAAAPATSTTSSRGQSLRRCCKAQSITITPAPILSIRRSRCSASLWQNGVGLAPANFTPSHSDKCAFMSMNTGVADGRSPESGQHWRNNPNWRARRPPHPSAGQRRSKA